MEKSAHISEDGKYRWWLTRTWDKSKPIITFIMCNPSTADATIDDPTIRRCIAFAQADGAGGLAVVNLFSYRATNFKDLKAAPAPVGEMTDHSIMVWSTGTSKIVLAWGMGGVYAHRGYDVIKMLRDKRNLYTLGYTKGGPRGQMPRHPLFVPKSKTFEKMTD